MRKPSILFVDNDNDFLAIRSDLLELEGYQVARAGSIQQARNHLGKEVFDLVILDIRLEDDHKVNDFSGLKFAREIDRTIPVIFITVDRGYELVRRALAPLEDGRSLAQDFIWKGERPEVMVAAVRSALVRAKEYIPRNNVVVEQNKLQDKVEFAKILEKDLEQALRDTLLITRTRLVFISLGIVVILVGVVTSLSGQIPIAAISMASGVVTELIALLFTRFGEEANKRRDRYHADVISLYLLERPGQELQLHSDRSESNDTKEKNSIRG